VKTETIVGLFVLGAVLILFYLSLSIGSLRLDRDRYHFYKAYFDDVGGLEVKDPVKVAGVDVGWVSDIRPPEDGKAMVVFRVKKDHKLAQNAYAMVRQEGLLGAKYLELDPGDSSTGILPPGGALGAPAHAPASFNELINKFSDVATSFKAVASSLQSVVATREGEENLKTALRGLARASERIADFSEVLDRTLERNETNINRSIENMENITRGLKRSIPQVTDDIHDVSQELTIHTLPSIRDMSDKAAPALESLGGASDQARYGFREVGQVMEKVNSGKGFVGKLINEDEPYNDLKKTIRSLSDYTGKMSSLDILVDMHSETMLNDWNSKGYFELKLRPTQDYFYTIQLVTDEKGTIYREEDNYERRDLNGDPIAPPRAQDLYRYPDTLKTTKRKINDILFGFQFGKRFERLALRAGLFESTFGVGLDYYVPLATDKIHWITTLEAFDMKGFQRHPEDTRPHLKWLNKVYLMKHLYTSFGVDDFYSKSNQNFFVGGGIRFGDKDLKYLLPSLPISSLK
jgi:phospholipid/cholesterol/gamma-HCH transport system substrate-binding protein